MTKTSIPPIPQDSHTQTSGNMLSKQQKSYLWHLYNHFFLCFSVRFGVWKELPRTSHEAERKGYTRVNDICKSE